MYVYTLHSQGTYTAKEELNSDRPVLIIVFVGTQKTSLLTLKMVTT